MRTLIHLSDIHFGKFDPSLIDPLIISLNTIKPDLIIISGDLTQRAKINEFLLAQDFLKKLTRPYLVIPGNHDIRPLYQPLSRIIDPYDRYKKYIYENLEPVYTDNEIAVVSLTTIRSSAIKDGRVNKKQIDAVKTLLYNADSKLIKIVVSHHPLDLPIRYHKGKLARKADMAIERLAKSGVDIYLSGHYHRSSALHTAMRYKIDNYSAIAIQAGTVSKRKRGELQSFNVISVDKAHVVVVPYLWNVTECIFKERPSTEFVHTKKGYWLPKK